MSRSGLLVIVGLRGPPSSFVAWGGAWGFCRSGSASGALRRSLQKPLPRRGARRGAGGFRARWFGGLRFGLGGGVKV